MKKTAQISISLPVTILKEEKRYIAYTPALDLSTSGRSFEHAKKRFEEAVHLFIESLLEMGTAEEVLQSLGWHRVKQEWRPPVVISQDTERLAITI